MASKKRPNKKPADIRDIKPLVPQDFSLLWKIIGVGCVAILLLAGVVYEIIRRKRARVAAVPLIPAHERALAALQGLREGQLLEAGDIKRFHFTLSFILRQYFEERTGYPATDRTIEEIKRGMRETAEFHAGQKEEFVRILAQADLVKFTDHDARRGENLHLLMDAIKFVGETAEISQAQPQESVV